MRLRKDEMGSVLITKEKHGNFYYDASTDEALAKAALQILTERFDEGYWYHDPNEQDKETNEWRPDMLIENLLGDAWPGWDALEDSRVAAINAHVKSLKEKYGDDQEVLDLKMKKVNQAIREYKHRREYRKWYWEVKRLVESKDWRAVVTFKSGRTTPLSWHLLSARSDHQYEGVELENLQKVEIG